jgi:hypothetical protein
MRQAPVLLSYYVQDVISSHFEESNTIKKFLLGMAAKSEDAAVFACLKHVERHSFLKTN